MRRADRLLLIIQILRRNRHPIAASSIAAELEVSQRTIYRDMVALESTGVPIRGEAGVGYVLEDGYDLPPLMFTEGELEALVLGARMVDGRRIEVLSLAAQDAIAKIGAVLPADLSERLLDVPLYAPRFAPAPDLNFAMDDLSSAIRGGRCLHIAYCDLSNNRSERTIWPVHLSFFTEADVLVAWCVMRADFRAFRLERIERLTVLDEKMPERRAVLMQRWHAKQFFHKKGSPNLPGTR
jgi:predicted DNA-binding transcriptional regulator YafY